MLSIFSYVYGPSLCPPWRSVYSIPLPIFLIVFLSDLSFAIYLLFIYFFREGKGGRKRRRETSMCGCLLRPPTGDLAHNAGMCPDWESNQRPFGSEAGSQSTEPHQPGPFIHFFFNSVVCLPSFELCEFFIYFGAQTLSNVSLANMFSHTIDSFFILLMVSLAMQKLFNLM